MKMKKLKLFLCMFSLMLTLIAATSIVYADSTPEGTPVSTPEQLLAMENEGSYYLVNDIDLSAYPNKSISESEFEFKGTIDGNGFKIKNFFTTVGVNEPNRIEHGLFINAYGATFKNIELENVSISVKATNGDLIRIGALVSYSNECTFTNVKVSGKINLSSDIDGTDCSVGGIFGIANNPTVSDCQSATDITVSGVSEPNVSGIGEINSASYFTISGCKNSGNISVIKTGSGNALVSGLFSSGFNGDGLTLANCKNIGKVALGVKKKTKEKSTYYVAGLCTAAEELIRCGNEETIKLTGKLANSSIRIAGLSASGTNKISQSYNSGKIFIDAASTPEFLEGAGIVAYSNGSSGCYVKNSYNSGNVTYKGSVNKKSKDMICLAGITNCTGHKISYCYNTGSINASKNVGTGAIVQSWHKVKKTGNYYTKGTSNYRSSEIKKVSKISKSQCPKLSSKYWIYSSKKGRMILRNNKEA